jgi:hypothetical protein
MNKNIDIAAHSHVVREQTIEIDLKSLAIEPDIDRLKMVVTAHGTTGPSRSRTVVIPGYMLERF